MPDCQIAASTCLHVWVSMSAFSIAACVDPLTITHVFLLDALIAVAPRQWDSSFCRSESGVKAGLENVHKLTSSPQLKAAKRTLAS